MRVISLRSLAIPVAALLLYSSPPAPTVSFSDGTFNNLEWSATKISDNEELPPSAPPAGGSLSEARVRRLCPARLHDFWRPRSLMTVRRLGYFGRALRHRRGLSGAVAPPLRPRGAHPRPA